MIQVASTELKRSSSSIHSSNPSNDANSQPNGNDAEIQSREPSRLFDCFSTDSISSSLLHKYAFHYLLLNDKHSLTDSCEAIARSIESEESLPPLSMTDQTRLQLLVLSLCTVSEDGLLSLQPSQLQKTNPSEWIWKSREKSEVMKRFKAVKRKRSLDGSLSENEQQTRKDQQCEIQSGPQTQPKTKRNKRSKQSEEEMIAEYSITLPTVSLKFEASILSPFLQSRIESNSQQFNSYLDQMEEEPIE